MSYTVKKNQSYYNILEKKSGTLIEIGMAERESDVRATCRKLNLGSGFEGWTPLFFTKRSLLKSA
jgi:hypothetical protein|tara:strand:- start:164 stop:358 length:195 start_codon:yes stop_codon:yes gene_type:complete